MSESLDSASERLGLALDRLSESLEILPANVRRDARWRASALSWSLVGAPDVAFELAQRAAEQMADAGSQPWPADESQMGAHLAREFTAMRDAGQLSRFALESGVRSLHSSGDLMAQLVRTSLLNCGSERCSLATMLDPKRQCQCLIVEPQYARLTKALGRYRDSSPFRYVSAASNRLKHRNLIPSRIKALRDPASGAVTVGQSLRGFSHNGRRVRAASLPGLRQRTDRHRLLACIVVAEITRLVLV